ERERRLQAVQQARIDLRYHQLLDRPARPAVADSPFRRAVALNEILLEHHQRLALQHRVAVLLIDQFGRYHESEAARQVEVVQRGGRLVDALIVLRARAAAETHGQFTVPTRPGPPFALTPVYGRRLGVRIVEDRDAVDAAIDRARIDAHDVGHGLSVVGR